jgi:hypothetical protein
MSASFTDVTIQSPKRCVLKEKQDDILDKDKTMNNVQKRNICTNVPSSETFRSYLVRSFFPEKLYVYSTGILTAKLEYNAERSRTLLG